MSSKTLMKVLTTPSKIASALDWKKLNGSVLSLDIHKDRIGLAIASHPSFGEPARPLDDIPLVRRQGRRITQESMDRLATLAKDYRVCGVVVAWPLQQDTGRMGASCGRTLNTLEELLQDSSLCTPNRPLCLWEARDPSATVDHEPEDQWGRSTAYSRTSQKTLHKASEEQYNQDETIVTAQVWEDFCRSHWPELYQQQPSKPQQLAQKRRTDAQATARKPPAGTSTPVDESFTNWEDSSSYVNAALL